MKKVAILLADGFEEVEALGTADILRRAGIEVSLISIKEEIVTTSHKMKMVADKLLSDDIYEYDMVVLPGGLPGAEYLSKDERVLEIVRKFDSDESKFVAAICAAPALVLPKAGIENDRYITSYPGEDYEKALENANYVDELVVIDNNLITSRGPATTFLFAYKLVDVLGGNSEALKAGMLWNMLEEEKE